MHNYMFTLLCCKIILNSNVMHHLEVALCSPAPYWILQEDTFALKRKHYSENKKPVQGLNKTLIKKSEKYSFKYPQVQQPAWPKALLFLVISSFWFVFPYFPQISKSVYDDTAAPIIKRIRPGSHRKNLKMVEGSSAEEPDTSLH